MSTGRKRWVLIVAGSGRRAYPLVKAVADALSRAGHDVACIPPDPASRLADAVTGAGRPAGEPPEAIFLEITEHSSLLPLHHIRRVQRAHQQTARAPLVALVREQHLGMAELAALADDFLLPPYLPAEIVARLALVRRRRSTEAARRLGVGRLDVDLGARMVHVAGGATPVTLTPREYDLLAFLMLHQGKVFTREMLLAHVWGRAYEGGLRTVDIHVRRLRSKLPPAEAALLETVHHVGYRLSAADGGPRVRDEEHP